MFKKESGGGVLWRIAKTLCIGEVRGMAQVSHQISR
jgi:hypothetical protein